MSIQFPGAVAPEAGHCSYGESRLRFRGPERRLDVPYVAFIGGGETYGRFVSIPFAEQVERVTGRICINLGAAHTGVDAWLADPSLTEIAARAEQVVIQLPGAQGLSNPFYRVHPRRNDRLIEALPALSQIFPETDFTEFAFVNHMLVSLHRAAPRRFATIQADLQQAWVERMLLLVRRFAVPPVLLWLRYDSGAEGLGGNPVFVGREMVERLRPAAGQIIALDLATASAAQEVRKMHFGEMQAPAAARTLGPSAHKQVAKALLGVVTPAE